MLLRGSTLVRCHLETSLFNVRQEIRFSVAGAEGGGSPIAAEVDSGRLSHHAWSGNSKVDKMARSGATRYAVAPGDVYAHGAAWDKATDLAHFLTEAPLYICSSGEWSADTKSADELEVRDVVPVARARL